MNPVTSDESNDACTHDHAEYARAAAILKCSDVWDMTIPWTPPVRDFDTLKRFKNSGFTYVSLTLQDWPPTLEGTLESIREFKERALTEATWLTMGTSIEEIESGRRAGKLVAGINSQDTRPAGEELERIGILHSAGVRHMVLAYQVRNLVADGCAETSDAGLSNYGRQFVREMNCVGMIVDCSHTGRRSSLEAMELSDRPTIFSHSNPYALHPHIRNINDEQIRACAKGGGVVGVVGFGAFLGDAKATTESVFRQIDYIASLVGGEHVGLGTDFLPLLPYRDNRSAWLEMTANQKGWPDESIAWPTHGTPTVPFEESSCFQPEQIVQLVRVMLRHGYSEDDISRIVGGNFRRVYVAASAKRSPV